MISCGFVPPISTGIPNNRHQLAPRRKRLRRKWLASSPRSAWKAEITENSGTNEPVEDGVTLPKPVDQDELMKQSALLQSELTHWLNSEWQQSEYQSVHDEIGKRAGMIYTRQRMEGEDDLTSVMLAIGSELEGMDFSQSFVGPWNVANRAAELLLEHFAGERIKWMPSIPENKGKKWKMTGNSAMPKETKRRRVASPSLADSFERMMFLRDVLDGSASKELIDGAVAIAMGYLYDTGTGKWDGSQVEDEHFRSFANEPPDILGDENKAEMTETLVYLDGFLQIEEDTSEVAAEDLPDDATLLKMKVKDLKAYLEKKGPDAACLACTSKQEYVSRIRETFDWPDVTPPPETSPEDEVTMEDLQKMFAEGQNDERIIELKKKLQEAGIDTSKMFTSAGLNREEILKEKEKWEEMRENLAKEKGTAEADADDGGDAKDDSDASENEESKADL